MLTASLINTTYPQLQLDDSVAKALQLMNDYKVYHLPVLSEGTYLGLVSEDDLLDVDNDQNTLESLTDTFVPCLVFENQHFLAAISACNQHETMVVPVLAVDKGYLGLITTSDLLRTVGHFTGTNEIGGIIVLEVDRRQFSISEISRIVESNNATVLHLNTMEITANGFLEVTLHISKKEISAIVSAFGRYNYNVTYYFGAEVFENEMQDNFDNLMHFLNI